MKVKSPIWQYGSLENYINAMEKSVQEFLSNGSTVSQEEVSGRMEQTETLTKRLTADLSKDVTSPEIQEIVCELVNLINESNKGIDMGENYWKFMAETYLSAPAFIEVTDKKYGTGASKFMGLALKAYLDRQ